MQEFFKLGESFADKARKDRLERFASVALVVVTGGEGTRTNRVLSTP